MPNFLDRLINSIRMARQPQGAQAQGYMENPPRQFNPDPLTSNDWLGEPTNNPYYNPFGRMTANEGGQITTPSAKLSSYEAPTVTPEAKRQSVMAMLAALQEYLGRSEALPTTLGTAGAMIGGLATAPIGGAGAPSGAFIGTTAGDLLKQKMASQTTDQPMNPEAAFGRGAGAGLSTYAGQKLFSYLFPQTPTAPTAPPSGGNQPLYPAASSNIRPSAPPSGGINTPASWGGASVQPSGYTSRVLTPSNYSGVPASVADPSNPVNQIMAQKALNPIEEAIKQNNIPLARMLVEAMSDSDPMKQIMVGLLQGR